MSGYKTKQEEFWGGEFGDDYVGRNTADVYLASNVALFAKILNSTANVNSVIELGANIGLNLRAIHQLLPAAKLHGVEINHMAAAELTAWGKATVTEGSIFDVSTAQKYDLSLIKGVLIHINPDYLNVVYQKLYEASSNYVCICEYYNPTPVSLPYRGHADRLFKRDFAGEMLEKYKELALIDYGFVYRRDVNFPQDDITWFLLQKKKA